MAEINMSNSPSQKMTPLSTVTSRKKRPPQNIVLVITHTHSTHTNTHHSSLFIHLHSFQTKSIYLANGIMAKTQWIEEYSSLARTSPNPNFQLVLLMLLSVERQSLLTTTTHRTRANSFTRIQHVITLKLSTTTTLGRYSFPKSRFTNISPRIIPQAT
jgi:hypothetical protein